MKINGKSISIATLYSPVFSIPLKLDIKFIVVKYLNYSSSYKNTLDGDYKP